MTELDDLRLSLPDVAELAHVQRPVVSTWRRRYARGAQPFPEPVSARAGSPRFRASEVVAWIESTGLGNNAAFRADVALRAVLDDAVSTLDAPTRLDGLGAALAIKAYTGMPLAAMDRAEVLDLADELDPEDAFLYREVAALGGELGRVCDLADLAASAAYTPGAAVEALLGHRFRERREQLATSALRGAALHLLAAVVHVLGSAGAVEDPFPGPGDVLHAVLSSPDTVDLLVARVPAGDPSRLARRRLTAHGWDVEESAADDADPARVVVTAVPAAGEPELDDVAVLHRVDDIVLSLHPGQRAVVLGPASALAEAATPSVEAARAALLRTDRLRAVVLLPPGFVVERPRQRLALWVLGDAHPSVPIAKRWTMVSDLSDQRVAADGTLGRAVLDDLLTDVVAALGTPHDVRAHAFRSARFVEVAELLARGGSLAAAGRHVIQGARDDGGSAAVHAQDMVARLCAPEPRLLDGVAVERGTALAVRRQPLTALLDRGWVRRLSGNRLEPWHIVRGSHGSGSTRVIGVPELLGEEVWGSRVVDTFGFVGTYSSARLTEPGDVVFCTAPYPAAAVDVEGFSVVQFPAQVLRVTQPVPDDGAAPVVVPEVLAADIAAQPPGAKWWRAWEARLVPADQAGAVRRALGEVRAATTAARARIALLDRLATTLTDGVTSGVVRMRQDDHHRPVAELVPATPQVPVPGKDL